MKLFARVPQQIFRQLVPYLQDWKLSYDGFRQISDLLFESDAFLYKAIDLLLVVLDIILSENLALGVSAQQPQIFVSLASQLLVNFMHYVSALAFLRELDVALHFLDNLHKVDFFGRDDVADVCIYYCIFLEDFLHLKIYCHILFVVCIVFDCIETEVLPVVHDIDLFAHDQTLAGLYLID